MRITLVFLFCISLLCGCATGTATSGRGSKKAIMPGDRIVVASVNRPDYRTRHVVSREGEISLPQLGKVLVAGLSLEQAEKRIERTYFERGMYSMVDVSVSRY